MYAEPRLAAAGITRRYGYRTVLRDLSLTLCTGDVVVLLGPNGAGKTTLLRVLAGLLRPHAGSVARHAPVGFVAHEAMVYDALSARENLRFFARLHGVAADVVDGLLQRLGLADRATDRAGTFSRGMLQRLSIARALLPDPGVLLLDEPFTGLDRASTAVVRDLLTELKARGTAMLVVSHRPEELDGIGTATRTLERGVLS
ncbi:MAG: ABC transporter ATP-binding protein [Gemmatimonadales bacterium]